MTKRVLAFALIFCTTMALGISNAFAEELQPVDTSNMVSLGTLGPSFYWIHLEKEDGQPKDQKVLSMTGKVLAMVSATTMRHLKLEGTAKLLDGRMLNYHGYIVRPDGTKEIRYRYCGKEAPYGYGWEDRLLQAFKSVAIDPSVVPMDSTLYIPAARGAKLPDGTIHDGMFKAVDIGSAIVNRRIDVFTSFGDQSSVFSKNGLKHGQQTEVFLVK